MRKAINIFTLVFFLWLVLDALNVPNEFFNFLFGFLATGAVPGTTLSLTPTMMMALLSAATLFIAFEILARRYESLARVRQTVIGFAQRNRRATVRRLGRA